MPTPGRSARPQVVQVSGYYPPHVGGVEYCALNISRELSRRGVRVSVLTSDLGAPATDPEPADAPSVQRLRSVEIAHTPIMPGLPWALWRQSRRAVIHLHVSHVWSDVVTTLVARLGRRPLVSHFHMDTPPSGPWGFVFVLYKKLLLGWLLRRAQAVIALSDEQAELLSRRYRVAAKRIRVIPNGVAAEFFGELDGDGELATAGAKEAGTPRVPLRLLFVGRLAAQKDLPLLLAAAEQLGSQVTVDIVGDGELRAEITELAAALPEGRARLWGALSGAKLLSRYREADAFVMTSEREGMPLALLEAMAAGLPIVASDVQGLREFVGGVGLLVSERSAAGFAEQIQRLIEDPELRSKLGAASTAAVQSRRWDALAVDVLDAYTFANGGPIVAGLSAGLAPKGQPRRPQQRESHQ
ncbi:MAG: glycosyltransferase family 1 protein [Mycobacterium sp.]|nr:glycosyltransferase family 1 protein [Mycobacterium sp.]